MESTQQVVHIGFEMVKIEKGVDEYGGNRRNRWGIGVKRIVSRNRISQNYIYETDH